MKTVAGIIGCRLGGLASATSSLLAGESHQCLGVATRTRGCTKDISMKTMWFVSYGNVAGKWITGKGQYISMYSVAGSLAI